MTDKRQKATKVKSNRGGKREYSWNIFFFKKSIWVSPELVHCRTQNFTTIDKEYHEMKEIYIWNFMTNGFII